MRAIAQGNGKNEPSEDELYTLVKDAGFTAREIKISDTPFTETDE